MTTPDDSSALQFCIMLAAGLPATEAITYFTDERDPGTLSAMLRSWTRSRTVRKAQTALLGRSWTEMTLDERIKAALDQHYSGLAYLLHSSNYLEANAADKAKLDSARQALEAKLAGTAGKTDALSQFFADINSGKVKLQRPPVALAGN
jgi:hypothetical protein